MRINILIALLIVLSLTGCWDERVLEDLALITVITVDENDEGEGILLAASYPEFAKGAQEEESILAHKARTTAEALHKLSRLTDKIIVTGQIQVILIGEDLAKKGIHDILDTLQRNVEVSSTMLVCITEGRANDFLTTAFKDKPLDGFYISRLIRKQERINELPATSLHEFQNDFHSIRTDPVLPYLRVRKKEIDASETAIFLDDKFIGTITTEETQLLVMLRNDGTSSQFTIQLDQDENKHGTVSFVDSWAYVDVKKQDKQIFYDVTLKLKSEIIEYEGVEQIHDDNTFKEIGSKYGNYLEALANEMVITFKNEYGADPVGLGEYARSLYKRDTTIQEWRESFRNSEVNIKVEMLIDRDGDYR